MGKECVHAVMSAGIVLLCHRDKIEIIAVNTFPYTTLSFDKCWLTRTSNYEIYSYFETTDAVSDTQSLNSTAIN